MSAELKPCPKCEGDAVLVKRRDARSKREPYQVECRHFLCHTVIGPFRLKRDAIAAWNRRSP